ncbi:tyrosine-type recombinase/integrase [Trueperella pyogenes]|uniref:tyrosine-type recombinase/integrase n=1 Tax=Trueperella pyogenes TaxID=1661 RepID=UPI00345D5CD9
MKTLQNYDRQITLTIIRDWKLAMRARSLSDRTIAERTRVAAQFFDCHQITPYDTDADLVLAWMAQLPSQTTRWSYFSSLRSLFIWMEHTGRLMPNPLMGIPIPKRPKYRPRPLALEHIEFVLSQKLRKKTRCMILLAFNCGLRVSEIAKVRGQDYDRTARTLTVEGKGGRLAVIPVNDALASFFDDMPRSGYWFPSHIGGHIRSRSVGDRIVYTFRRYGITMTSHQLRHSFGTELLRAGVDIRVTQELMRHESIQTTALYTKVSDDQQREGTNLLPVFSTSSLAASTAGTAGSDF